MTNLSSPEHAVELLDRAFNDGDLEAVLSFYEESAVVIAAEPLRELRGSAELRSFFAEAIRSNQVAKQMKTRVIEVDGIALFFSRWSLSAKNNGSDMNTQIFIATSVFRRQSDGTWKILIDNPFGPLILDWALGDD
jgi:ketosteroid isomerase-like protein